MGKKVVETVVAPVAAAPVMQKESKKTSKKTEAAPVAEPAPVAAPVEAAPVAAPVEAAPVDGESQQTVSSQVHELLTVARENAHQLSELARQQESRIRQLEKMIAKLEKEAGKRKRRVGGSGAKKGETPKGFNKKYQVSDALCSFLGMDKGSQMTRLEIVGRVRQYANDNNLKDPQNGRVIIPDAKLTKLFNVPKDQQLTIFNIQRYITPHVTAVDAAPAAQVAAPAPVAAAAPVSEKKSKKTN